VLRTSSHSTQDGSVHLSTFLKQPRYRIRHIQPGLSTTINQPMALLSCCKVGLGFRLRQHLASLHHDQIMCFVPLLQRVSVTHECLMQT
jgi:hypothetical protein